MKQPISEISNHLMLNVYNLQMILRKKFLDLQFCNFGSFMPLVFDV